MKALVVDKSSTIRTLLIRTLCEFKVTDATEAGDAMETLEAVKTEEFDIVLMHWRTLNELGINFLHKIRDEAMKLPVIMVTMRANKLDTIKAIKVAFKES